MGNGYFNLSVAETLSETEDTVSIVFELPDDIKDEFKYKAGQFVNFKMFFDGKPYVRAYSMSSSPHTDKEFIVTVKAIPDGIVSQYLVNELKPGDQLLVSKPKGKFALDFSKENSGYFIMFAAGSGITPLFSMIKSTLFVDKESKVTLFYSNRSENTIIFKEKIEELESLYAGRFKTVHLLTKPSNNWSGLKGRLNSEIAQTLLSYYANGSLHKSEIYLCGPDSFMDTARQALIDMNVSQDRIKSEKFNTVKQKKEPKPDMKQITLGRIELKAI